MKIPASGTSFSINIKSTQSQPLIQQDLKRLRLRSTPYCTSVLFYLLGVIYLVFLCLYGLSMSQVNEVEIDYGSTCGTNSSCILTFDVPDKIRAPFGLYYRLSNFFQLHRTIANSFSSDQLRGKIASESELEQCQPQTYINDTVHNSNLYVPCGLLPYRVFNDTFSLLGFSGLVEQGITLNVDRNDLYKTPNNEYNLSSRWLRDSGLFPNEMQDEHFIAWMRQSSFAPFRKLYAISSDQDLPSGTYQIVIQNNYPLSSFKGTKSFVISEIRMFGTLQSGPSIVFGAMAAFFFVASAIEGIIGWRRDKPTSDFYPDKLKNLFVEQK